MAMLQILLIDGRLLLGSRLSFYQVLLQNWLSQAYQLLGPNSIFTTLKKSPRKKNFESGCESHKVAENVGKKNDQINDQNTIYVTDLEATKKINNKSMSSDKVVNEEPSLVEPDDSNNNKKWMKQKVMSIRFK